MSVRVRFAPSPTGYLHVGGARTALYNYLFAKNNNGKFILRIEDTDRERSTEESVNAILDSLKWLNINWDEGPEIGGEYGPYFQSQRDDTYKPYIEKLLKEKNAYKCFCTKEELDAMREEMTKNKLDPKYDGRCRKLSEQQVEEKINKGLPFVIRIKIPETDIIFNDLIRGEVKFTHQTLDDFVIVRSDNNPVYNFVVTIDDLTMKISHVIRGEDHIANTPKQIVIYKLLGEKVPEFAHIPLILGHDKKRLSKRHGATSTMEYKEKGYPIDAFVNYIALVGWAYDDKTTIFSREELIKLFSIDKVSKSPGVFDEEKLNWISGQYIKSMGDNELYNEALPFFIQSGINEDEKNKDLIIKLLPLVKERAKTYKELADQLQLFFNELSYDEKAQTNLKKTEIDFFNKYIGFLEKQNFSDAKIIHDNTMSFIEGNGKKPKDLMPILRSSVCFSMTGPDLFEIFIHLGKEKVLMRLNKGLMFAKDLN